MGIVQRYKKTPLLTKLLAFPALVEHFGRFYLGLIKCLC